MFDLNFLWTDLELLNTINHMLAKSANKLETAKNSLRTILSNTSAKISLVRGHYKTRVVVVDFTFVFGNRGNDRSGVHIDSLKNTVGFGL